VKTARQHASYLLLIAFLGISTGFVYWPRSAADEKSCVTLSNLPMTLGKWSSKEVQLSDEVLSTLGAKDYLLREYKCGETTVTLYITYFNTGSGALTHNPEKCYTGSGWTFLDKKRVELPGANQMVLESTIARGDKRQLVVYWYQERAHVLVSKWRHISGVLWRALAGNQTHSLVASVSAPVDGPDSDGLEKELAAFSGLVMSALAERLPS
jgi:EpsI family protein